jgi:shikimate kinase
MTRIGEGIAHGAITIVNAIAAGKGAALGVDLWTRAKVQLTDRPGNVEGILLSDPDENPKLIKNTVLTVLRYFGKEKLYGANAETDSNIPIARGLKSSSVAANALVLATAAALEMELGDLKAISLGVEAAMLSRVTITGAFDDASASFFGNAVVTDNTARRIEKTFEIKEDHNILLHIPPAKSYTSNLDVKRVRLIASQVEAAYREALEGRLWTALTLNGLLYCAALGYDTKLVFDALSSGAVAAGLTGKGPAIAVITPRKRKEEVHSAMKKFPGDIIETSMNREKAHALGSQ